MITNLIIEGKLVFLRQIEITDCNETYLSWMNDIEINRFMETKWQSQTSESIKEFVIKQRNSEDSYLFAIICKDSKKHIGNIKIGPVHPHYHHADISYFIGDKRMWGKGFAKESVHLICKFGFENLNLHKIEAGTYDLAVGSQKVLEGNGFKKEGSFREKVYIDNNYIDVYRYGLLKSEFV